MFARITIGFKSPEPRPKGPFAQPSTCVRPSPNQKILSSEHFENCGWKRAFPQQRTHPELVLSASQAPRVLAVMSCCCYFFVYSFIKLNPLRVYHLSSHSQHQAHRNPINTGWMNELVDAVTTTVTTGVSYLASSGVCGFGREREGQDGFASVSPAGAHPSWAGISTLPTFVTLQFQDLGSPLGHTH